MSPVGSVLEAARSARGLSLEEASAATRIRVRHLSALERDSFAELPAPVYVRGYLRTYATFLDLDGPALMSAYDSSLGKSGRNLAFRPLVGISGPSAIVLTAPMAGAIGVLILVFGFTGYIYRELDSVRVVTPTPGPVATALPSSSPSTPAAAAVLTIPTPAPALRSVSVVVTATDTVWIDVQVDGKPQFGDAGRVLDAGATLTFTGQLKVRLTSGKATATQLNVNGRDVGALGAGVVTREFTPQS